MKYDHHPLEKFDSLLKAVGYNEYSYYTGTRVPDIFHSFICL